MPVVQGQKNLSIRETILRLVRQTMMETIRTTRTLKVFSEKTLCLLTALNPTPMGCSTCTAMYGSGAAIGMMINITMSVRRKVWSRTLLASIQVRTVCFVAGAGTTAPSAVGRLVAATTSPTTGTTSLASAWSSSRSQLAAHSGFVFEREGRTNILVSGVEGRSAARQNVSVTTDNRNGRRRRPDGFFEKMRISIVAVR